MSPAERQAKYAPKIRAWLWLVTWLVFAMVLLGGATRLTDSGLSIVEWQPIWGAIPPLNDANWREAFEAYQRIPEYQTQNRGMTLAEFQVIYWWEWSHRILGRAIAVVFAVPFVIFLALRAIGLRLFWRLAAILLLGAAQGGLGWYMVQSGLADRVDVSQYRLAAHLILAALIFAALIWTALGVGRPRKWGGAGTWMAVLLIALVLLQIVSGGFMAGLDAGHASYTWPRIDGAYVPLGLYPGEPWWRSLFEHPLTVHFDHRILAYAVVLLVAAHAWQVCTLASLALLYIVLVQMGLGVITVLLKIPLSLALAHQAGAMLVLAAAVANLHRLVKTTPAPGLG